MSKLTDEATFSNQASTCLTLRIFFFWVYWTWGYYYYPMYISAFLFLCLVYSFSDGFLSRELISYCASVEKLWCYPCFGTTFIWLQEPVLRTFPRTRIEHVFREANQRADVLAKLGAKFSAMYVSFVIPPVVVVNRLALDREATSCNRLISVVG